MLSKFPPYESVNMLLHLTVVLFHLSSVNIYLQHNIFFFGLTSFPNYLENIKEDHAAPCILIVHIKAQIGNTSKETSVKKETYHLLYNVVVL